MGTYDVQQVCFNGHQVTDRYYRAPEHRKDFCDKCGEKTIHECPACKAPIKGDYKVEGVCAIGFSTPVPTNCENCGQPFPWTDRKKQSIADAAMQDVETSIRLVERICSRFHLVAKQLRTRHDDRETLVVKDEYDVQDLLHSMLRIYFDDIRNEEWTPSYAGSCSRIDFLIKTEQIVIEVKKTRETLKAKQIGEQLIVDIQRYQTHTDCKTLLCFIYDPEGWVSNPRGLENDLNKKDHDFEVKVLIVPKGY